MDEFLTWNPESYGGITDMVLDSKLVWLPEVILFNE